MCTYMSLTHVERVHLAVSSVYCELTAVCPGDINFIHLYISNNRNKNYGMQARQTMTKGLVGRWVGR